MPYTLKKPVSHSIKIQRSEFIAFIHPVPDAEDAQKILREHQLEHSDATHNCYAYVLGYGSETQYYSDAGEPGGTAGKPILNSLLRNELSGVLAIVTRYYGGIKLGVKGLIEAYTQATTEAIELAKLIPYQEFVHYIISTHYSQLEKLRYQITASGGEELSSDFSAQVKMRIKIPKAKAPDFTEYLASQHGLNTLVYILEDNG